jgi:hypothetical protein
VYSLRDTVSGLKRIYQALLPKKFRAKLNRYRVGKYSLRAFDRNQCIFIHIPKTGGVSVAHSLFGNLAGGHRKISDYQLIYGKRDFHAFFKFTFVRNPWDRLLSSYLFLKRGGYNRADAEWAEAHLADYETFEGFVKSWVSPETVLTHVHFIPQHLFVCDASGNLVVDFIGRFEQLAEDFEIVRRRLGILARLEHHNRSEPRNYRNFYTEATEKIVERVYRKDIELFGYSF